MSFALELSDGAYMYSPFISNYNFGTSDFTLEAWIKTTGTGTVISSKGTDEGSGNGGYLLVINPNGQLKFTTDNGTGIYEINTGNTIICNGQWHFLSGIRHDNVLSVYLDGTIVPGSVRNTVNPPVNVNNNLPLCIGFAQQEQETYRNFNGSLGEVRIWNRALSQQDILDQMNIQLNGNEPGLVAYYTFNNHDGNDSSINSNNALPYGSVGYSSPGAVPEKTTIDIPSDTAINLSSKAYSAAFEKVLISISGYPEINFSGTGSGVDMKTPDNLAELSVNSENASILSFDFSYSITGPQGTFVSSNMFTPEIDINNKYVTVTVKAEDADNQSNYVIFTVNWDTP
jgi:hypothetical protein